MDYKFIADKINNKWVISSPRRARRPSEGNDPIVDCPFCVGNEQSHEEAYRISNNNSDSAWKVRVINNKFPFAPIHEIVIHSPDHHKSFDELPMSQVLLILQTFRQRYIEHRDKGQVCIFHNHGDSAGQSQPHPHSQVVVIPDYVELDVPKIGITKDLEGFRTEHFVILAPEASEWPDEVWVAPRGESNFYSSSTDEELEDLARLLYRLIQIFDLRHGHEFAFNFYISPHKDWYLRLIPRQKIIGGFELATNVWVNTQDPKETIAFIKEHFDSPNEEKIRHEHRAEYNKTV